MSLHITVLSIYGFANFACVDASFAIVERLGQIKEMKTIAKMDTMFTMDTLVNAFAKYFLLGFTMLIAVFDPIFKWRRRRGSRQRTEQSAGEMTPTRPRVRHHASE